MLAKADASAVVDSNDWTVLHEATARWEVEAVQLLLENKANVNAECLPHGGIKPVAIAVRNNRPEVVACLLEAKANPDEHVNACSAYTLLNWAESEGFDEVAKVIRAHQAITAPPIAPPAPNPFANGISSEQINQNPVS